MARRRTSCGASFLSCLPNVIWSQNFLSFVIYCSWKEKGGIFMESFSKKEYLVPELSPEEQPVSDRKRVEAALATLGY